MTELRARNNRAREYSRNCRKRRLGRHLWCVNGILLLVVLALLLRAYRVERQNQAAEDVPAPAETVEPTAALIGAVPRVLPESFRSQGWFTVTGYCACCTPYNHMNTNEAGQVLTASGEWVDVGTCVAVDTDVIPLGSTVVIGDKAYIAYDTGVYGHVIDILLPHEEAQCFGAAEAWVTWW